ncbi:MAG: hypothetical protein LUG16_02860, partial [Candidatus Gastranaerophilales bacterium]|nr:hypothetical protein [Candidatus Gastranaerophilales bacterium]
YINNLLIENIDTVFDEETLNLWREKFYNLIYLLKQNSKNTDADKFYTILKNDEYFSTFKSVILQRSIFNHFGLVQKNLKDSVLPVNIFRKRNSIAQKYDYKKVSNIVNLLRKNWIYE